MAKRLSAALGVDIGTQSIKIAAVRLGKDGAVVTGLGMAPTPEGVVDHTGIFDPQPIGEALKGLISSSGVGIRDVVFCLNGQSSVVVRILEVPRMSDNELTEHMHWEIQRNVPFSESSTVSDFRPIDNPALANSTNMEVVMAVSPRSAIDNVITLMKAAGCKAGAIDVEPLGLGRVLKSCHFNDLGAKNSCVVHVGHSTTAINMYRQGTLAFPRSIPLGGSVLTKAIAESLSIGMAEAERMKTTEASVGGSGSMGAVAQPTYQPMSEGEGDEPQAAPEAAPIAAAGGDPRLQQAMQPHLDEFVAEVRRSIDYFKSRGGEVEDIGLSGGGANLRGLADYMNRSLGYPVMMVNPLQGVEVALSGDETFARQNASQFAVAIGMGLHIAYE